jgi:transcription initiation factor TFIID TATA-box-binding protein
MDAQPVTRYHRLGVVNVVCTMSVGRRVNPMLSCMATHGKLCMAAFPAHVSKCKFPPSTNCSFWSGKLVNTGSINAQSALLGATMYIDRIAKDIGYDLRIINFEVENIVGAVNLGFPINLDLLLDDGKELFDRKWEPSLFPGLKLESSEPDVVFIIFKSGNVIATGMQLIGRLAVADRLLADLRLERYIIGQEYRSLAGVPIHDAPVKKKKTKKPNQFKVINHTKKRAQFKASLREPAANSNTSGGNTGTKGKKRSGEGTDARQPQRKRVAMQARAHVHYQRMGDLMDTEDGADES